MAEHDPRENSRGKITAILLSGTVIVPDIRSSGELFSSFYGKPAGVDKPKPGDVSSPVILDPLEAVYLCESGIIRVVDSGGAEIGVDRLKAWARERLPRFDELYPVYRDLRGRGFVVRSGLRYGSDFTVYRFGPGIDHSPYIVHVFPSQSKIDPVEIVKAGRLSHSVKKTFILSTLEGGRPVYLMFKWFKP
ncbi:MAG: tRNA-intron lyase [Desulfurococcales archaeon]|nr:tRNA-intron lyase [Desulfurococcales archaeon]